MISTKRPLDHLHLDLFRPTRTVSLGKSRYGMVIVDYYFRYTSILFLRNKGDAFNAFERFAKHIQNEKRYTIISLRLIMEPNLKTLIL